MIFIIHFFQETWCFFCILKTVYTKMKLKEKLTNIRNKHNPTLKVQTDRDEDIGEDTGKGMGTGTETMLNPNNALLTSWQHQTHQYITWSINHVTNNVTPNCQMLLHDWYGLSK